MADARKFVLRNEDGTEYGVYTGKQPRHAALKVANQSEGTKNKPVTIKLHVHRPLAVTLNETPEEFHISTGLCQKIQIKFTARGLWTRTLTLCLLRRVGICSCLCLGILRFSLVVKYELMYIAWA